MKNNFLSFICDKIHKTNKYFIYHKYIKFYGVHVGEIIFSKFQGNFEKKKNIILKRIILKPQSLWF